MFKIAICDDEPAICNLIEKILIENREIFHFKIDTEVFFSCNRLITYMQAGNNFDLIFLDIEMEGLNGLEFGLIIRNEFDNQSLQIVYVSGKDRYYKDLFDVRPMHFLSKPIEEKYLLEDVRLAMKLSSRFNDIFCYKKSWKTYNIPLKEIIYFQSIGREIIIVTTSGNDCYYGKLSEICTQLKDYSFIQIHKSFLVNYEHIIEHGYKKIRMSNLDFLAISQSKRKKSREFRLKYELLGD